MAYDVMITRQPLCALFELKGEQAAVEAWGGTALPTFPARPNRLTERGGRKLIWTGPERWLLAAPLAEEAALAVALRPDEVPEDISVVLVSDTLTFFAVTGPDAGEVMAVATPLDLCPDAFPRDGASWSEAFGTKALICRIEAGYEVAVDRSYGDWFGACLTRTAR